MQNAIRITEKKSAADFTLSQFCMKVYSCESVSYERDIYNNGKTD